MRLRRLSEHVRTHNWLAVATDFVNGGGREAAPGEKPPPLLPSQVRHPAEEPPPLPPLLTRGRTTRRSARRSQEAGDRVSVTRSGSSR